MQILTEGRGSFFDPMLIDAFAGIAGSLYGEISGADDKLLDNRLDGLIDRYFSTGLQESARLNCWEFMKCGREIGGAKVQELGVCPTYPDHGKHCASIVGTFCGGEVQGTLPGSSGSAGSALFTGADIMIGCSAGKRRHYEPSSEKWRCV